LRPTRRTVRRHWFHLQRRRKGERSEKSIDRMKSFVEVLLALARDKYEKLHQEIRTHSLPTHINNIPYE
jgi:hypothetical protein